MGSRPRRVGEDRLQSCPTLRANRRRCDTAAESRDHRRMRPYEWILADHQAIHRQTNLSRIGRKKPSLPPRLCHKRRSTHPRRADGIAPSTRAPACKPPLLNAYGSDRSGNGSPESEAVRLQNAHHRKGNCLESTWSCPYSSHGPAKMGIQSFGRNTDLTINAAQRARAGKILNR